MFVTSICILGVEMKHSSPWRLSVLVSVLRVSLFGSIVPLLATEAAAQAVAEDNLELPTIEISGNGSKDQAATENSGSYAGSSSGVGSKSNASTREVPQTISVMTRQRLDDQNLTTLEDALKNMTGMNVMQVDAGRADFYSRGHHVDTIQVDGVTANLNNFFTHPDLYVYDRVEVLRGPNALFNGGGSPSASVNLSRKRALDFFQIQGSGTFGTFDTKRAEFDVTGPLHPSKRIRARFVGVHDDKKLFLDNSFYRKPTAYGTVEVDFTENTTLSVGMTYTELDYLAFFGLPAFANGQLLNVPRSTFYGADWSRWKTTTLDKFAEAEHRFDNGGRIKVAFRNITRDSEAIYTTPSSAINPVTGNGNLNRVRFSPTHDNTTLDAFYTTPFELFGQTHNLTIGADQRRFTYDLQNGSAPAISMNVFNPVTNVPFPNIAYAGRTRTEQNESGAYGQLRVKPLQWLTLVAGGRFSRWDNYSLNKNTGVKTNVAELNGIFTKTYGAVVDILPQVSLYASYADIFVPQTAIMANGDLLPPRTGSQREAGVKTSLLDGRLIGHLAFFRIHDVNRSLADPSNPTFSIPAGEVESKGYEAEVTGKLAPGWDITAGYAYTETKYLRDTVTNEGTTFSRSTPAHSYNIWTRYEFQEGLLRGFSVGGGAKIVSSFYAQSGAIRWVQDGYQVLSAQIGYKFTPNVWATLTANNLLDQTYYQWVNGATSGNRYGEPRSVHLKVSAKW